MRLIAYCRVSTDDQAEHGHSLGQQPDRIRAWAAANGHEILATYSDEGVSGSVPLFERPKGSAMRARLLRRGDLAALPLVDGVVAQRVDRLFRSARDGLAFAEDFAIKHRVALLTVDGAIDTSTPSGWLMLAMQLVTAQYERLMDIKRATETSRSLRESGRQYGHVPFGCVAIDGKIYRDRSAWNIREEIVRMREHGIVIGASRPLAALTAVGIETLSSAPAPKVPATLRDIRAALFAMGVPAPTGGKWWPVSTIRNVIETHADLTHLPYSPARYAQFDSAPAATRDAEVSHAA